MLDKDKLIIFLHIPIGGLSKNKATEVIRRVIEQYDKFFDESVKLIFLPNKDSSSEFKMNYINSNKHVLKKFNEILSKYELNDLDYFKNNEPYCAITESELDILHKYYSADDTYSKIPGDEYTISIDDNVFKTKAIYITNKITEIVFVQNGDLCIMRLDNSLFKIEDYKIIKIEK